MKTPFFPQTDKHRFNVVWKGQHYCLASLSEHLKYKVSPTGSTWLLIDRMSQPHIAPRDEVTMPFHQGQTNATV